MQQPIKSFLRIPLNWQQTPLTHAYPSFVQGLVASQAPVDWALFGQSKKKLTIHAGAFNISNRQRSAKLHTTISKPIQFQVA
jgi:hypothetical protein